MESLEEILHVAYEAGASDIHLTVGIPPTMRLNGHLVKMDYPILRPEDTLELCLDVLNPVQREKFEERGEYDLSVAFAGIGRYRVNVFKQRGAIALALRTITDEIPDPEKLGVPKSIVDLYQRKRGLVLVTGPTGSGKSTTLASIINKVNENRDAHIITLEEPIEYAHHHKMSMVNQREIGQDVDSFAGSLRAALREDPDVILVGEMRDFETINAAVTAAETGHLVFSTLHTTGAAETIDRIIDVYPPHSQGQIRSQLANSVVGIISQTLVPTADGKGRCAALEILAATDAIRSMIREGKIFQVPTAIATGKKNGMFTLDQDLARLVNMGKITKEVALTRCQDPNEFKRYLSVGF